MNLTRIFLITPAYNEAQALPLFLKELKTLSEKNTQLRFEVVLADDGSTDETRTVVIKELAHLTKESLFQLHYLKLTRNFGHQSALQAGLEYAFKLGNEKDLFIMMDSDLQHPPSLIPDIVKTLNSHALEPIHHVQMLREDHETSGGLLKRSFSHIFYRFFSKLSGMELKPGSSDFRGISYPALKAYLQLQEKGRFNRGLFYWIGYPVTSLNYRPDPRVAGQSKYSFKRMFKLALNGATYFSSRPLVLGSLGAILLSLSFCLAYFIYLMTQYYKLGASAFVLGWPALMAFIAFWGGLLAFGQLLQSLYLSRVFEEVKNRPHYFIQEILNSKK